MEGCRVSPLEEGGTLLEGYWLDEGEEVGAPGNMSPHPAALKPMLTF